MKLTIIPLDGAVYEDGLSYSALMWKDTPVNVHALQWQTSSGWIEFNDGTPNEDITVLPQWANNAMASWQVAYDEEHKPPPPPTPPTAEENKATATGLLQATDWTTIADVGNPKLSNPYLSNQEEFILYRNTVRNIAVYPTAGYIDFPAIPNSNWVKV
jgi:hypothetical protein